MAKHVIYITNGKGSLSLVDGTYNATANVIGYDASTLDPSNLNVENGVDSYSFKIGATGALTIHVTDNGDDSTGVPVEGAVFYRTDSSGTTYGEPVTTNSDGDAVLEHLPFSDTTPQTVYYKQTTGDGEHTFSEEVKTVSMNSASVTVQVENPNAAERNFTLTDANYENLIISDAEIELN